MSHPYVKVATSLQNRHRTSNIKPNSKKCNDRLTLSERVLTQWQCLVAYMKALDLLHQAMRAVEYRCIAMTTEIAIKLGK
jgi:hypothetical protein